jgi:uncharacterized membrane protein
VRWLSLAVAATASAALSILWDRIPPRWITHWSLHDRADGWATKSMQSVFGPLLIGAAACIAVELLALWMRRRATSSEPRVPPEMVDVQIELTRAVGAGVMVLTAALALMLPLLQPRSSLPTVLVAIGAMGSVLGPSMLRAHRRVLALRARGVAIPEGYGAVVYRNPKDPRLMVPKLLGVGWTLNFAHRSAWPVVAVLALPPVVVLIVVALAR